MPVTKVTPSARCSLISLSQAFLQLPQHMKPSTRVCAELHLQNIHKHKHIIYGYQPHVYQMSKVHLFNLSRALMTSSIDRSCFRECFLGQRVQNKKYIFIYIFTNIIISLYMVTGCYWVWFAWNILDYCKKLPAKVGHIMGISYVICHMSYVISISSFQESSVGSA